MLAGGHPNSLGRTVEVVRLVLGEPARMTELMDCYKCDDEVVRLRTSNAIRRVFDEQPSWFEDWVEHLLNEVSNLDQSSAKWTLSSMFLEHGSRLSANQRRRATALMIRNFHEENDWIVLNRTIKTLLAWLKDDPGIAAKIKRRVTELTDDERRSVSANARKALKQLAAMLG